MGSSPIHSAVEFARGNGLIRYFQTSRVKTQNTDPLVFGLNVEKKRELERWQSWSIASDLKSEERVTVPWVRILLSPQ